MKHLFRLASTLLLLIGICAITLVRAANYTPGEHHLYAHEPGDVPADTYHWEVDKFKRLLDHVKSKVKIDANRVYVIGFSIGGQGAWQLAGSAAEGLRIAAMIPIGAWGCDQVQRGTTPETCLTAKTPVCVQHCPFDDVSKISEQILLYQNHLDGGGYGRFTMSPGKGHIDWPGGAENRHLDLRMEWLLSQTFGTPANYFVQVDGGIILEAEDAPRGPAYIGDSSRHGFFEPGIVLRITAPATRNGERFVRGLRARPPQRRKSGSGAKSD